MESNQLCPCGSGHLFVECCGRYLEGGETPITAEALMRSRYTAYTQMNERYLLSSWHPLTRPEEIAFDEPVSWLGLNIVTVQGGGPEDSEGKVEFIARFEDSRGMQQLHERSRFLREAGVWYYVNGVFPLQTRAQAERPGRNAPCPCGSGKKYKYCCGR